MTTMMMMMMMMFVVDTDQSNEKMTNIM